MSDRRTVRATRDFFARLDTQLDDDRGPLGEPSRSDFQTYELLRIVEEFAARWDALPPVIAARPDYRVLITAGVLGLRIAVTGQLSPIDGAVELVDLDLEFIPWNDTDDNLD